MVVIFTGDLKAFAKWKFKSTLKLTLVLLLAISSTATTFHYQTTFGQNPKMLKTVNLKRWTAKWISKAILINFLLCIQLMYVYYVFNGH